MNKRNNKDPYGIPNVCFSVIRKEDKRWNKLKKDRLRQGFDESELWDFEVTLCSWLLPRVEWYYKHIVKKFQQKDIEVFEKLIYCLWFLKNQYEMAEPLYALDAYTQGFCQYMEYREYLKEHLEYILNMGW